MWVRFAFDEHDLFAACPPLDDTVIVGILFLIGHKAGFQNDLCAFGYSGGNISLKSTVCERDLSIVTIGCDVLREDRICNVFDFAVCQGECKFK